MDISALNFAKVCLGCAMYDVQLPDTSLKNLYHFQNLAKHSLYLICQAIFQWIPMGFILKPLTKMPRDDMDSGYV